MQCRTTAEGPARHDDWSGIAALLMSTVALDATDVPKDRPYTIDSDVSRLAI